MREDEHGPVPFLYRVIVWVDAYRLKVFSGMAVAGAVGFWLTGSGYWEFVAIASLVMLLSNWLERFGRRRRTRPESSRRA